MNLIPVIICAICLSVGHPFVLTGGHDSGTHNERLGTHPQIFTRNPGGYRLESVPSELRYDYDYNAEKRQLLLLLPLFDSSASTSKNEEPAPGEQARYARAPPLPRLGRVMKRDALSILDSYTNDYDTNDLDGRRSKRSIDNSAEDTRGKSWFLPRLGSKRFETMDNIGIKDDRSLHNSDNGSKPMKSVGSIEQRAVPVPRMGRSQGLGQQPYEVPYSVDALQ